MRLRIAPFVVGLAAVGLVAPCLATTVAGAQPANGPTAQVTARPVAGCPVFPADNIWHADVSRLPVAKKSDAWLRHMSPSSRLHPDFGPSYGEQPVPYGIPITVVGGNHPKVHVKFGYAGQSDKVRYPLGRDVKVEGGWNARGDRHVIIVDQTHCKLFETWNTKLKSGHWTAGSGAVWNLRSNALRPDGWTSADAAGLPILPGLLRWSEVKAGKVDHAIRFTTDVTDQRYVWPARHQAGSVNNRNYPPMGARFRLQASFKLNGFSPKARVILNAMKHYGLILADNGSPWYFQGDASRGWKGGLLDELKSIPANAFEAVDTSSLRAGRDSGAVKHP